jgi:hypothetical protein
MDRWNSGDWRRKWNGQRAQKPVDLMSALKKSPAKVVILASCSSATIPLGLSQANFNAKGVATWKQKVAGGPAVIVMYSPHFKTWSFNWGHALTAFLLDLIDYEVAVSQKIVPRKLTYRLDHHGTIQQALDAANIAFMKNQALDTFVLVSGSGSTVVFPDRPLRSTTEDIARDFIEKVI